MYKKIRGDYKLRMSKIKFNGFMVIKLYELFAKEVLNDKE
jgi:hypothetical protein